MHLNNTHILGTNTLRIPEWDHNLFSWKLDEESSNIQLHRFVQAEVTAYFSDFPISTGLPSAEQNKKQQVSPLNCLLKWTQNTVVITLSKFPLWLFNCVNSSHLLGLLDCSGNLIQICHTQCQNFIQLTRTMHETYLV